MFLGGVFSHAVRRAPLLTGTGERTPVGVSDVLAGLRSVPLDDRQRAVAETALGVLGGRHRLTYARVDLIPWGRRPGGAGTGGDRLLPLPGLLHPCRPAPAGRAPAGRDLTGAPGLPITAAGKQRLHDATGAVRPSSRFRRGGRRRRRRPSPRVAFGRGVGRHGAPGRCGEPRHRDRQAGRRSDQPLLGDDVRGRALACRHDHRGAAVRRAQARTRAADDRHPFGYGRETYFWAFLAALCTFGAGAGFSIWQGFTTISRAGGGGLPD